MISIRKFGTRSHSRSTVFFIGVNDCAGNDIDDLETIVEAILNVAHDLYVKATARNFVLIDLPPINRSPQGILV